MKLLTKEPKANLAIRFTIIVGLISAIVTVISWIISVASWLIN
ncbi:hypothetical protein [Clostridium sp.]|jgi:hypothetical protein